MVPPTHFCFFRFHSSVRFLEMFLCTGTSICTFISNNNECDPSDIYNIGQESCLFGGWFERNIGTHHLAGKFEGSPKYVDRNSSVFTKCVLGASSV